MIPVCPDCLIRHDGPCPVLSFAYADDPERARARRAQMLAVEIAIAIFGWLPGIDALREWER